MHGAVIATWADSPSPRNAICTITSRLYLTGKSYGIVREQFVHDFRGVNECCANIELLYYFTAEFGLKLFSRGVCTTH